MTADLDHQKEYSIFYKRLIENCLKFITITFYFSSNLSHGHSSYAPLKNGKASEDANIIAYTNGFFIEKYSAKNVIIYLSFRKKVFSS